ncbi:MAG: tetratricopeptide repeat protein [Microscillaceae bacterium]|nr:tetratricopeptide repeat protein [Microscillaceae bacterium]MDW8461618.1 tetratricopeptide repeat protein [Cytophagales bacterium]
MHQKHIKRYLILGIIFSLIYYSNLQAQSAAEQWLKLAAKMYHERKFTEAIVYYEKIIKTQPLPEASLLAKAYHNLGSTKLTYYQEIGEQNYLEVLEYFEKAIQFAPQEADNYYSRGLVYWLLQQDNKALADLEKALELKPNFSTVHILRGKIYWKQGLQEEACAEWENAAYKGNLKAYDQLKQYCQKIERLPVKPQTGLTAEQYLEGGKSKFKSKLYKEAEEYFTFAIQIDRRLKEAYYWRGLARLNMKQVDAACADWRKAKDLGDYTVNQFLNDHCGGNYR